MKKISKGIVQSIPVQRRQLGDQRNIVANLDALRAETHRLESLYRRKIAALDELKKSLLHQAFNGDL